MVSDNVINSVNANLYTREEVAETLDGIQGNREIGPLDEELVSLYVTLVNAEFQLDDLASDINRRFVEQSMSKVLDVLNGATGITDFHQKMASNGWYEDEAEASMMLERVARWERLNYTFWYDVRSHFNNWIDWLEIRSGFRVVSIGKKWMPRA